MCKKKQLHNAIPYLHGLVPLVLLMMCIHLFETVCACIICVFMGFVGCHSVVHGG